jgi:hypothetical protein
MIADRSGPQPRYLVDRKTGIVRPQCYASAVGRAYLMLIDRENPLSSPYGRI